MRFKDRIEFEYDPETFGLGDTQTALKIYAEYTRRHSPRRPLPKFFEVDRRTATFDHLWHVPLTDRTVFSRVFEMPVIVQAQKPDWRLTRVGVVPLQKNKVWMAHVILQEMDWWPVRGDLMYYNGYRNMIITVEVDPTSYWQQTNVWMGIICTTVIPPEGDARPLLNPGEAAPAEIFQTQPVPEA